MYNKRIASIECDGCGAPNDGHYEPGKYDSLASTMNPKNAKELQWFWLCGDCGPDYDYDPKKFYVADFFENEPYCERCEEEPVENWGHVCDYCEDGII